MRPFSKAQKKVIRAIALSGGEVCQFPSGAQPGRASRWAVVDALGCEREKLHPNTMAALLRRGLLRLKRFAHGGMVYAVC